MKTNVQELSRLIHWPAEPLRVQWQVLVPPAAAGLGPDDWQLAAVIEFEPGERGRLLAGASAAAIDTAFSARFVLPWFPPALKARFSANADGSVTLQQQPLDAAAFHSAPLSNGFFVPFGDGGEVLLFLYTR